MCTNIICIFILGFTLGTPEGFIIPVYIDKSHDDLNVEIAMPSNNNAAVCIWINKLFYISVYFILDILTEG